jgi:dTMP kinase
VKELRDRGVLIAIEGLDGSGKTTHARILNENLRRNGHNSEYTKEPSIGKIGSFIQSMILYGNIVIEPTVEALLFAADRVDHIESYVEPRLKQGRTIISDRYIYSSLAYQGARGVDLKWLRNINEFAPKADISFYIDVPPEVALSRKRGPRSVFERLDFQTRVRNIYLEFARAKELRLINGNNPLNIVQEELLSSVENFLG